MPRTVNASHADSLVSRSSDEAAKDEVLSGAARSEGEADANRKFERRARRASAAAVAASDAPSAAPSPNLPMRRARFSSSSRPSSSTFRSDAFFFFAFRVFFSTRAGVLFASAPPREAGERDASSPETSSSGGKNVA